MEVNQLEFRKITGLSGRALQKYIDNGMPVKKKTGRKGSETKIDTVESIEWLIHHYHERKKGTRTSQRERLAQEQADKVALDNAIKRGTLIRGDMIVEILGPAFSDLGANLDGISGRLANELAGTRDPAIIRSKLFGELRKVRASFAQQIAELVESPTSDEEIDSDHPPAPRKVSRRVGGSGESPTPRKRRTRTVAKRSRSLDSATV